MVQWLGLSAVTAVAQVQPLVWELICCKPCSVAKKKKKRKKLGGLSLSADSGCVKASKGKASLFFPRSSPLDDSELCSFSFLFYYLFIYGCVGSLLLHAGFL